MEKKIEKKVGSDTETGPWFWFPILKPGFGCSLISSIEFMD